MTHLRSLALPACVLTISLLANGASDKLSPGEHDAPLQDVQLHYTVAGQGPLVFVCSPGWGVGSLYLQRGLAPLEEHFTLLFIDTRGSGKSSRPQDATKMKFADMVDDLDALRSYLQLQKITLIGHEDSATIGLFYGERYPDKLAKLVFIDGESYGHSEMDKRENQNSMEIRRRLAKDPRYKTAVEPFKPTAEGDAGMMQEMQHGLPLYFADPEKNLPVFARTFEGMTPSSWAQKANIGANRAAGVDSTSRLGEIKAATLVVVGKQDWMAPVMNAEDLHKMISGSQLVEIDNAGHFPWIEQPAAFFDAVNSFLTK